MCISENISIRIGAENERYLTISEGFPGITRGDIKVTKENSITIAEGEGGPLVTCTGPEEVGNCEATVNNENNVSVKSCIDGDNKIWTKNGSDPCAKIKDKPDSTGIFSYYSGSDGDDKFKMVSVTGTSNISYAYSCNFGTAVGDETSVEVTGCTQVIGYTVATTNYAVYCSGLKGKDCKVQSISGSCINTDEGKLLKSGTKYILCFGSNNSITLPTGSDVAIVAFYTDVASQYYGKFGIVFLKLTKNAVSPAPNNESM